MTKLRIAAVVLVIAVGAIACGGDEPSAELDPGEECHADPSWSVDFSFSKGPGEGNNSSIYTVNHYDFRRPDGSYAGGAKIFRKGDQDLRVDCVEPTG